MMNVETDITVGPVLRWYAERKGVLYALAAGDEPAACKELYDFAEAWALRLWRLVKAKIIPLDRHATPVDPVIAKEAARPAG
jgi:predicted homoserine dehydrogenase-like protein